MSGIQVQIDVESLRPMIEAIVRETISQAGKTERLSYSESEAAELLGLAVHQLRDRRLDGEIRAKRIGRSFYYTRGELEKFLK